MKSRISVYTVSFIAAVGILGGCSHRAPSSIEVVQGRYDMVCPIVTADALVRAWPEAKHVIIPDAGHSAMEPGIRAALVRATETMKTRAG